MRVILGFPTVDKIAAEKDSCISLQGQKREVHVHEAPMSRKEVDEKAGGCGLAGQRRGVAEGRGDEYCRERSVPSATEQRPKTVSYDALHTQENTSATEKRGRDDRTDSRTEERESLLPHGSLFPPESAYHIREEAVPPGPGTAHLQNSNMDSNTHQGSRECAPRHARAPLLDNCRNCCAYRVVLNDGTVDFQRQSAEMSTLLLPLPCREHPATPPASGALSANAIATSSSLLSLDHSTDEGATGAACPSRSTVLHCENEEGAQVQTLHDHRVRACSAENQGHCMMGPETCCAEDAHRSPGVDLREERQRNLGALGLPCVSLTSFGSASSEGPICRICHEGALSNEDLIAPCRCSGTLTYQHRKCLEQWLQMTGRDACELCDFHFMTERKGRPFSEWIRQPERNRDRRNILTDCSCFTLLTPLVCVSTWLCLNGAYHYLHLYEGRGWEGIGLITLASVLILIYLFWSLMSLRYHCIVWRTWRQDHQRVRVVMATMEAEPDESSPTPIPPCRAPPQQKSPSPCSLHSIPYRVPLADTTSV